MIIAYIIGFIVFCVVFISNIGGCSDAVIVADVSSPIYCPAPQPPSELPNPPTDFPPDLSIRFPKA